jgi:hypothetical protein
MKVPKNDAETPILLGENHVGSVQLLPHQLCYFWYMILKIGMVTCKIVACQRACAALGGRYSAGAGIDKTSGAIMLRVIWPIQAWNKNINAGPGPSQDNPEFLAMSKRVWSKRV